MCTIVEDFGFRLKSSHIIYMHDEVKELLNFQDVSGKANPYRVRLFIKIIEKYNLVEEGESSA